MKEKGEERGLYILEQPGDGMGGGVERLHPPKPGGHKEMSSILADH
jgi:hypothetical protein